jgi:phosphatidylinositol 4-kinase
MLHDEEKRGSLPPLFLITGEWELQVVRHTGSDQLLLLVRLMQASMQSPNHFSSHPAAAGAFFTLLVLGLKLCDCLLQSSTHTERLGVNLLRDRVYR